MDRLAKLHKKRDRALARELIAFRLSCTSPERVSRAVWRHLEYIYEEIATQAAFDVRTEVEHLEST